LTAKAEAIEAKQLALAATSRAVDSEREKIAGAMASVREEVGLLRVTLANALADTAHLIEARQPAGRAMRSHPLSEAPDKAATTGSGDQIEAQTVVWLDRSWGFSWPSIGTNSVGPRTGTDKYLAPIAHEQAGGGRDHNTAAEAIVARTASTTATATPQKKPDDEALTRASALVRDGDIMGARLLLEHALERGSAEAAFALAATYDPHRLSAWRTLGIRADPIKAQQLYARALAGGVVKAKGRLEALR
jgi:hypothetical protein